MRTSTANVEAFNATNEGTKPIKGKMYFYERYSDENWAFIKHTCTMINAELESRAKGPFEAQAMHFCMIAGINVW